MKKLLELLNEYDSNWGFTDYWSLFNCMNEWISGTEDLQVISKKFWFIQWLVYNDKIDLDKVEQEAMSWFDDESPIYWKDIRTARLIMMLSVDDRPIQFLVSILK